MAPPKVGSIEILQCPSAPISSPESNYAGLHPSTTILPKGFKKSPEFRAFPVETVFERDVALVMRDGIKIRVDIFRPNIDEKVPALIAWSPYGKSGSGFFTLDAAQNRAGIPRSKLSGFEKFEAPDPAEWVERGYAIVNADQRGIFDSEGDMSWLGSQDAQDFYDAIEEIAKMEWCSGVALVGNSWLAMAQYNAAALRPPHLKCIAPFEGQGDNFRESLCRGGVPFPHFAGFMLKKLFGRNYLENVCGMMARYPFYNEYWEDKRAKFDQIEVPTYMLASYSTFLHTEGSFRAFREIRHENKWLRVHPTQEWHDLYQQDTNDDLQRFLDRYTKGIQNGWESITPKVRLSLLNFNSPPVYNRPYQQWPIPNTKYQTLFLTPSAILKPEPSEEIGTLSYQSDVESKQLDNDDGELIFIHTFAKKTSLIGPSKAILYISCQDYNDMDVFAQLRKLSSTGQLLQNTNIPLSALNLKSEEEVELTNPMKYLGPMGILRASTRELDEKLSTPEIPVLKFQRAQKVVPGEIVKLEFGIWETGIIFEAGEKLALKIAGHRMDFPEFAPMRGLFRADNKGLHIVHMGGENASRIEVPLFDEK